MYGLWVENTLNHLIWNLIPFSVAELKNALQLLPSADFLKRYGIDKPKPDANLVFSCRSGKRSRSAMETAVSIGFLK